MDNQKVIVILLLITIILAVVSVILTVSINLPALEEGSGNAAGSQQSEDTQVGYVGLEVSPRGG